jgi:hypothetical protein
MVLLVLWGCWTTGFVEMSSDGFSDRRKAMILVICDANGGIGLFLGTADKIRVSSFWGNNRFNFNAHSQLPSGPEGSLKIAIAGGGGSNWLLAPDGKRLLWVKLRPTDQPGS